MTTLHDTALRGFASDNYSGVHPEVLSAIAAANDRIAREGLPLAKYRTFARELGDGKRK